MAIILSIPLFTVGLDAVWYNHTHQVWFSDLKARTFLTGPGPFGSNGCRTYKVTAVHYLCHGWTTISNWGKQIINHRRWSLACSLFLKGFSGYVPLKAEKINIQNKIKLQRFLGLDLRCCTIRPQIHWTKSFGRHFSMRRGSELMEYMLLVRFTKSAPPVSILPNTWLLSGDLSINFSKVDPRKHIDMQGWSLREGYRKGCPKTGLLILDLDGSLRKTECWWGYPVIMVIFIISAVELHCMGTWSWSLDQYVMTKKASPNILVQVFSWRIEQNQYNMI